MSLDDNRKIHIFIMQRHLGLFASTIINQYCDKKYVNVSIK